VIIKQVARELSEEQGDTRMYKRDCCYVALGDQQVSPSSSSSSSKTKTMFRRSLALVPLPHLPLLETPLHFRINRRFGKWEHARYALLLRIFLHLIIFDN